MTDEQLYADVRKWFPRKPNESVTDYELRVTTMVTNYNEQLSRQYHSIRFYDGATEQKTYSYRIGNQIGQITEDVEHYYDSWKDLRLIPTERPVITLPKANTKFVSIPGKRYPIDLTNYLTGHPTYTNRTGSWSFIADTDFVNSYSGGSVGYTEWLNSLIHGHIAKIVLRDDPSYFYAGELTIGQFTSGDSFYSISISYNLFPYKKTQLSSMDWWKFDDFYFEDDIIQYLKDMEISGERQVVVIGSSERVSPHISGSQNITIEKFEGDSWVSYGTVPVDPITSKESIIPGFVIGDGENILRFSGNGTVTIDYRRGLL